jgi:hydroxymethylbilane synthase
MSATALRLGTRRSPLALAQSRLVAAALERRGAGPVELVEIATLGDVSREPLTQLGGTGVFVSALRDALLAGEVDLAVHSLKDLPVAPADGLLLAAIPTREDPRDALVARDGLSLAGLPDGARIGTGSPRRAAQLRALGRDFDLVPVRGNVGTRIGYATSGEVDAVVLALAGLARLGRLDAVTEVLDAEVMLPAPGQGALAVECRSDRADVVAALAPLDDPATRVAVTAERALLARTEAGCSAPVGALAEAGATQIHLRAVVGSTDGSVRRLSITGPLADPVGLGFQLADRLLDEGAEGLWGVRVR